MDEKSKEMKRYKEALLRIESKIHKSLGRVDDPIRIFLDLRDLLYICNEVLDNGE